MSSSFYGYIDIVPQAYKALHSSLTKKENSIKGDGFFIQKETLGKFYNDETLFEDEYSIVVINGVIFNLKSLRSKHQANETGKAVFLEYTESGEQAIKNLRGSFSGLIYDKAKNHWVIFTNHFADKQVFYSLAGNRLYFGSNVKSVTDLFRQHSIPVKLDEDGVGCMLTYGFMLDDFTLIAGVKKLSYGNLIKIENGKFNLDRYWDFNNTDPVNHTKKAILQNVEDLFRNAIKLEFDKDREYGLEHFNTLSAGLDSRMTFHVAHEMGYFPIMNFTFSASQYTDQLVAQKMADDLGHSFIYFLLNENNFCENIDKQTEIFSGRYIVTGNIAAYNAIRQFDFSHKGLIHTGQLGDVVMGTFNKKPLHYKAAAYSGAYSSGRYPVIKGVDYDQFPNHEYFMMTQRAFNGALQGNLIYQDHTEVTSPFMDVDFFEYCLSIPVELRYNHKLYIKWIRDFHPVAARYEWEKIHAPLNSPAFNIGNKIIPISNFWHLNSALLPRMGKVFKMFSSHTRKRSMTPVQFWFERNPEIMKGFNKEIGNSGITDLFKGELKEAVTDIERGNEIAAKSQLLTIIHAMKFFGL